MQSFRSELENITNPVVEKDIVDLAEKIQQFRGGSLDEEKFKSLRLARGVYGQRQPGVQMVRIKLPYGRMTTKQLLRIADISEQYATGNLHATTRQDIQLHFVNLDVTPELWAKLEQDEVTTREACGNTVRNITAPANAGIDPNEPFDVTPYAHSMFQYFLRNPICQDMGRKFKISFSTSEEDTGYTFMHDIGIIPKVKKEDGKERRGFKVLIGGGLSAQPQLGHVAYDFLDEDQLIPFAEAILRVFDRYGERNKRNKARMKFLIKAIGFDAFMDLVNQEWKGIKSKSYKVDQNLIPQPVLPAADPLPETKVADAGKYEDWLKTNVFEQKQEGYFGVYIRLSLGDLDCASARKLAPIVQKYAGDEIRITINQGYLLRFVREDALPHLFNALNELELAEPGFDATVDITACPGTDTCNLGISNSTGISAALEEVIKTEYPELTRNNDIKIKISGCPNSCGQHSIANIGFHGSSMKDQNKKVLPAIQVLIGGGKLGNGEGRIAEKVIKIPSKRGPAALRTLLNDFKENSYDGEYFNDYYDRQGKIYFYDILKYLTETSDLVQNDYIDWGHEEPYQLITKAGECAGVVIDLISTLIFETEEKLAAAEESFKQGIYADGIYHAYNVYISASKALLLTDDVKINTQLSVLEKFDENFVNTGKFQFENGFKEHVLQLNQNEPTESFAKYYINSAKVFLENIKEFRSQETNSEALQEK